MSFRSELVTMRSKLRAELAKHRAKVTELETQLGHLNQLLGQPAKGSSRRVSPGVVSDAVFEWVDKTQLDEFHAGIVCDQLKGKFRCGSISNALRSLEKERIIKATGYTVSYKRKGATRPGICALYRKA